MLDDVRHRRFSASGTIAAFMPFSDQPMPVPLTREELLDHDRRRRMMEAYPWMKTWTDEELDRSLEQTLKSRPADGTGRGGIWVFAYGSLIWNPTFAFVERRTARIRGYHRRFCLRADMGRGTLERPGLFLGLDRGGQCAGVVFRIAEEQAAHELTLLWRREMITGAYIPRWLKAETEEGPVHAIAMTINRNYSRYVGDWTHAETIKAIAMAEGRFGRCSDYLFNTAEHLAELGLRDRMLERFAAEVRRFLAG
ncbi:gamma-glutamylcyclotransferase [Skermanella mucosa]|uniref:gamma-glutamylcyclotransferase n=1 Tax=Skermanella mucosa TaxID=1789672 RepID=UPI00192AEB9E|nr:gamma-glutamylcyclotransferase [Skermanella mucosa]UEM22421.1 gamma-glutamylcyclotransferase [Skermanella mucosa]